MEIHSCNISEKETLHSFCSSCIYHLVFLRQLALLGERADLCKNPMPDSYYTAAVVADIDYRRANTVQNYKSQDSAVYRGADAHNHGLFYPNKIILCRYMAVLAAAAGVIALGVFPADNLAGGVGAVYLRHVREAVARQGADGGGKDCRRDKL